MSCSCERERWAKKREELAGEGFEVGWSYEGHPTPEEKRAAVREMLDRHGDDPELWLLVPEIREQHIDHAEYSMFDRRLTTLETCAWAAYGVLKEKPEVGHVAEGIRIPMYGEREYDR